MVTIIKIIVTITRHVLIDIFKTEQFSTVKFALGYEKDMNFLWQQNLQKFEKSWKDATGLL